MTNEKAKKFAFDSFVTAFEPGNEHMIDQYFAADIVCFNHSRSKQFGLQLLKSRLPELQEWYQDLKSEVKDVITEDNRIAFRVEQKAFYVPDDEYITLDVMNLYKLVDGKVKEWRIWFNQDADPSHKDKD